MLFAGDGDRRGDEIQVSPCPYMTIARRIFPSCGGGARATGGRHKDERENKADSDEVRQGGFTVPVKGKWPVTIYRFG
ncbi:uncharacterized protein N7446_009608 [Penicillium canescens]|uniref:Uncharacterized protein n=1 Tax=Penicillium canescens TaxID=5083 RepID=A0AAD6N6S4_PENCN|nr:uncharacterized protein N7446_009608 [Penicillium canescens]KAJ6034852.1 hypothetical protein N7460_009027 [Penicillium canescens]KAJ6053596.1 hypothetical protein N7446_009608 [Penicillium canescens]